MVPAKNERAGETWASLATAVGVTPDARFEPGIQQLEFGVDP